MQKVPLPEEIFQSGNFVQIEFYDENDKKIIYFTYVHCLEKDKLTLMMPLKETSLEQLKPGTKMNIVYRNENEQRDYIFSSRFIETKMELPVLIINRPPENQFQIGRKFFRCDVKLPFSYFLSHKELHGEVLNLSASGLLAQVEKSSNTFELETVLTCQIILPTAPKPILLVGKITRIEGKGQYQEIALSFEYTSKELQDQITKYLFTRQRALINLGHIKLRKRLA